LDAPAAAPLITSDSVKFLNDWSPDGAHIVYTQVDEQSKLDLWQLRVRDGAAVPLLATQSNEGQARFSPDGRWVAYVSDENGGAEIYVARYPEMDGRRRISSAGGGQPQWRADQRELFYLAADRSIMAVDVSGEAESIGFGTARRLFRAPVAGGPEDARDYYAAAADGSRFLIDGALHSTDGTSITLVVNWADAVGASRADRRYTEVVSALRP
jgi:dipeptidyl aminopeptidase/acylaminoacyl peptidase